jgi:uncharacterized protein
VNRAAGVGAAGLAELAADLRAAGMPLSTAQVVACGDALARLRVEDAWTCYWAGRVTLCSRPEHHEVYDAVFAAWAAGRLGDAVPGPPPADGPAPEGDGGATGDDGALEEVPSADADPGGEAASAHERLRHRRFDEASPGELARIERLIQRLHVVLPERRSRRRRPGDGAELDLPRSLDRALRSDGELMELDTLARRTRRRPLVLVLDVSGSMRVHARALLAFALAARRTARTHGGEVEVFTFGTRLTRVTPHLGHRSPDAAMAAAAAAVDDWEGGTRIGVSIDALVRGWGRRRVLRGAVVVVCSDGLERGEPELLGRAVARLRRHAHRIVWVNPLAGDARYAPTQRGMATALPHVDIFRPGHDLATVEGLADVLTGLGRPRDGRRTVV